MRYFGFALWALAVVAFLGAVASGGIAIWGLVETIIAGLNDRVEVLKLVLGIVFIPISTFIGWGSVMIGTIFVAMDDDKKK